MAPWKLQTRTHNLHSQPGLDFPGHSSFLVIPVSWSFQFPGHSSFLVNGRLPLIEDEEDCVFYLENTGIALVMMAKNITPLYRVLQRVQHTIHTPGGLDKGLDKLPGPKTGTTTDYLVFEVMDDHKSHMLGLGFLNQATGDNIDRRGQMRHMDVFRRTTSLSAVPLYYKSREVLTMSVPCLVENDALADWAASDESLGWVMEDPNPAMDQPPTETPPTEAPASPKPTNIPGWARLQRHLQTAAHLRHEEALAAAWVETAQQVALVEDGGLPAERAVNSAHSSVGDGEALRLPLDAVIPDSDSEGTTPGAGVQTGRRSDLQDRQGWPTSQSGGLLAKPRVI
ncbi:unnamed protein product [Fusarium graminearum]|uniref:Uncharacterized protein n=1 Tax=Gibberella zeae TaxID=5518 RepID=A0A9N8NM94_GIBZA|nr:unnamed protein product [Fusarium graminearum]